MKAANGNISDLYLHVGVCTDEEEKCGYREEVRLCRVKKKRAELHESGGCGARVKPKHTFM